MDATEPGKGVGSAAPGGLAGAAAAPAFVPGAGRGGGFAPNVHATAFVPGGAGAQQAAPQATPAASAMPALPDEDDLFTGAAGGSVLLGGGGGGRSLAAAAPAFVPGGAAGAGSLAAAAAAPAFVPRGQGGVGSAAARPFVPGAGAVAAAPAVGPSATAAPFVPGAGMQAQPVRPAGPRPFVPQQQQQQQRPMQQAAGSRPFVPQQQQGARPFMPAGAPPPLQPPAGPAGGGSWFAQQQAGGASPRFSPGGGGGPPSVRMRIPGKAALGTLFVSDLLRAELQQRTYLEHAQVERIGEEGELPEMIHVYHSLVPLEDLSAEEPSAIGVRTSTVKGVSSRDGRAYVLRRVDPRQVVPSAELVSLANAVRSEWGKLEGHPHVAQPHGAFVAKDVDDTAALFFVHDYHAGAVTLEHSHLAQGRPGVAPVAEEQMWSYAVQLASCLRAVHSKGLACRAPCLAPSKVLVTAGGRLRLAAPGVPDVLLGDVRDANVALLQREDLAACGHLLLTLACGSPTAANLHVCDSRFGRPMTQLIAALLEGGTGGPAGLRDARQFCAAVADHAFLHLEAERALNDRVVDELRKELDNGRMLRLLVKLGFINERPDESAGPAWSETGDRYLLKLFRDHVFHQQTDDGDVALDWGATLEALNKLDAGVPERLTLLSRDEMSMLVASYGEIKRCVEGAYEELAHAARQAQDRERAARAMAFNEQQ